MLYKFTVWGNFAGVISQNHIKWLTRIFLYDSYLTRISVTQTIANTVTVNNGKWSEDDCHCVLCIC